MYTPPNERINWFDKMDKILDNFTNSKLEFIINGELNCDLLKQPLENHIKHFVHNCESHQLTQLVNKPTRVTPTGGYLIDVIMTPEPDKIVEHDVISGCIADHHLVYCVTFYKSHTHTQTHRTTEMRNFKNISINDFCNDLDFVTGFLLSSLRMWLGLTGDLRISLHKSVTSNARLSPEE